jgi:tetratricopeptide (TPR) repeat protein
MKDAESDLRRALELNPDYAFGASQLADLLGGEGRVDEALSILEGMLERGEDKNPEVLVVYAFTLELAGRVDDALAALDQALWVKPGYAAGLRAMGGMLLRVHRRDEALSCLRRAVDAAQGDIDTLVECQVDLSDALLQVGQEDEAWDVALEAARTDPGSPVAWIGIADIATSMGAADTAIAAATRAVAAKRWAADSYRTLGEAWDASGRAEAAERAFDAFDHAVQLEEDDVWARSGRADALRQLGRVDEALAEHQAVHDRLEVRPLAMGVKSRLDGWCLFRLGRYGDAVRALHAALSASLRTASILFDLVLVALAAGQASTARGYLERAVAALAEEPPRLRRGTILVAMSDAEANGEFPDGVRDTLDRYLSRLRGLLAAAENEVGTPLVIPDDLREAGDLPAGSVG